jgi:hypothetical protein
MLWLAVPLDENGKIVTLSLVNKKTSCLFCAGRNKMHGIVMFHDKKSVDAVMSQRVHRIDGKEVFIHRSVPSERSVKSNYGIEQLIVSVLNNQSLAKSDVNDYFSDYGTICDISDIKNDGKTWIIDFD